MPDVPMLPPAGDMPAPQSRTGDIIRQSTGLVSVIAQFFAWLVSLKSGEVLTFLFIVLMLFVCGMLGYKDYTVTKQQLEIRNAELRYHNERDAANRDRCDASEERMRVFFANQLELQRKREDDRDEKNRAMIVTLFRINKGVSSP